MAEKRKSYTDEFKKEVASAAAKPGATLKSVAEEFGVNPTLVRNWKIQFSASEDGAMEENDTDDKNVFVWHIDRAKFVFEDAEEYEQWKKEKKVFFEMDPSGADDGGDELFDDPEEGYAEFEVDDSNGHVSISLEDDGPLITAWIKWTPNLREDVGEDEVIEWGEDMGGWFAGSISLGDVDASISEDDGGGIRPLADFA